jgi:cysteine desulfurase
MTQKNHLKSAQLSAVSHRVLTSRPIYLDYNATAPAKPGVADAMVAALELGGNPSSVHASGRAARRVAEAVRAQLAGWIGARSQDVIFTSGGTEANRLALTGTGRTRILASSVEHPSIAALCPPENLLPVDSSGRLDLGALRQALAEQGPETQVSLMLANNETGVVQPLAEAIAIAHEAGALVHCDGVQGLGKQAMHLREWGVDLLSVSAHKIGGPAGIGALALRPGLELAANRAAGGQEQGRRPGTENLVGIAGFGAALETLQDDLDDQPRLAALRDRLEAAVAEGAVIFGAEAERLANTSCLAMPDVTAETQVMAFDLAGFCVSAGSACSSGKVQGSPVLTAMGVPEALAASAIRVSIGRQTTQEQVGAFAVRWKHLFQRRNAA